MASKPRCLFFLLLALSLSFQTHARDSKFFNKLTRSTIENKESITVPTVQTAKLTPSTSQESEVVQHGYGLYGQDPYDKYEYPPTTTNPTKTPQFDEEFSNSKEFNNNGNGYVSEKQGLSDTRFLENGKYFYDVSQEQKHGDAYVYGNHEKQGLSDTRFLENGKYFYDVNSEKEQNAHFNTNNDNKNFEAEKQGMSDTRFLENGKYFYDINNEEKGENAHFNTNYENENENENENFESLENGKYSYDVNNEKDNKFDDNNNENENENENENGKFGTEKQGMSDTRFLENGKYFYDVNNEKENNHYNYNSNNNDGDEDVGFHSKHNIEYAKNYNEDENNEHETRGGYNYNNNHNEYHAKQGSGGYNYPNKFPKYMYDTMEEYDRAQGNIDGKDHYLP